ncbi:MAG: hypothetical protein CVU14_10395 [Bacteroidetes bacterium HGW-Bacteroidetes-9]|nr:MAG: hypothetical protein CVU14_10395 [Bacteroidetes bacterium HGW-Bacteroidetes-9]
MVTTTYTLTVDDGCEASDAVTVNVNQLPAVSATASVGSICPDDQLTLNAGGAVNYTWSSDISDPSLTGQENSINPLVAPLANTTYTLTGTDANGCVNSDNVSVTVKERMFADFTLSQNAVCEGDPLIVTYSGNGNNSAIYNWNFDGGVSATTGQGPHTVSWTGNGTKTITLEVTQLACISAPFTQTVEVNAMPIADFTTGIAEGCVPITVSFTDNSLNTAAGVTYSWDFGTAGSQQGQMVNQEFTVAGKYNVQLTVTNPGGCINQKTKNAVVDAWPLPLAGFNANPESSSMKNPVIAFTSTSIGDNLTYEWNAGDGTTYNIPEFTHTYADSGYYRVELLVTNAYGCTDRFENQVFISPKYAIHIPGAFTPNGDGLNDVFQVHGNGVKEYSIWIYDRWGALVFFSNNIDQSWDGKIGGVPANRGIYVYHTYFKDENDEVSEKTGSINLLN